MEPKEKAKELVVKFMEIDSDSDMFDGFKMGFFYSQRCASIAVDEILNQLNVMDGGFSFEKEIEFWQQVKQEIEKL